MLFGLKRRGFYVMPYCTMSFGPIRTLNHLFITGYAHLLLAKHSAYTFIFDVLCMKISIVKSKIQFSCSCQSMIKIANGF